MTLIESQFHLQPRATLAFLRSLAIVSGQASRRARRAVFAGPMRSWARLPDGSDAEMSVSAILVRRSPNGDRSETSEGDVR